MAAIALGIAITPASAAKIANAAPKNPVKIPMSAPVDVNRFHHTDNTSTGNVLALVRPSAHSKSRNGSVGAISVKTPPQMTEMTTKPRAIHTLFSTDAGSHVRPWTTSSLKISASETVVALADAKDAAIAPANST